MKEYSNGLLLCSLIVVDLIFFGKYIKKKFHSENFLSINFQKLYHKQWIIDSIKV